jgi:SpoIIAA-like
MPEILSEEDFHGWDLGAAWDDLRFEMTHASKLERLAMVGDKAWENWMTKIGEFFAPEMKYFDASKVAEAERWVRG